MSLVVGQRMVRTDDGMKGVVELVTLPGYELQELRITYVDRGEKRIAGKRETWTAEKAPPRKLRDEEIMRVAWAADRALRSLDRNELDKWWLRESDAVEEAHDGDLVGLIVEHLQKRG
jgi:hypothetical protein